METWETEMTFTNKPSYEHFLDYLITLLQLDKIYIVEYGRWLWTVSVKRMSWTILRYNSDIRLEILKKCTEYQPGRR